VVEIWSMAPKKTVTTQDKQYLAKILFTREQLDQKVVAKRVGISENTMSKWVNEFNWKALRQRLLISKDDQLNALYEQLEALNKAIKDSGNNIPDSKQADIQAKITSSIRTLETDLAIADLVESGIRFIKHLQKTGCGIETVMEITDYWHSFIQASIKK
jgi:transposase-like protein